MRTVAAVLDKNGSHRQSRGHPIVTVRVWDPLVRIVHWSLAIAVALGWATTLPVLSAWHVAVGYVALALVAVRVVWGFVGPRTARFAAFVRSPRATWTYARLAVRGRARRHLGHNPLGGWMVLALFSCVAGLAATGWLYSTDEFWGDRTVERIHIDFAWAIVALAALHVAGVIVTGLVQRENLVAAMLHGSKRDPAEGDVI
jgi:cytochrome b